MYFVDLVFSIFCNEKLSMNPDSLTGKMFIRKSDNSHFFVIIFPILLVSRVSNSYFLMFGFNNSCRNHKTETHRYFIQITLHLTISSISYLWKFDTEIYKYLICKSHTYSNLHVCFLDFVLFSFAHFFDLP